jgi:peptide/nickel transport system permease protein
VRAYLLSRLGQTVLVVFLSLTAVFFLMRLGGDPVLLFLPMDIQAKDLDEFRERLGFNDPIAVQYGRFMSRAVRGDFGESLRYKQDALGLVLERLPATLRLALAALSLTFLVAVPVGVLSAVRRGSLFDFFGMGSGSSSPSTRSRTRRSPS